MSIEQNRSAVRWLMETAWNSGDLQEVETYVNAQVVTHSRGQAQHESRADFVRKVSNWRSAFPDCDCRTEDVTAEGDRVAVRYTFKGTQRGALQFGRSTIPATGKPVEFGEMVLLRFEEGRIVEVWQELDFLTMLQQLGVAVKMSLPEPEPATPV